MDEVAPIGPGRPETLPGLEWDAPAGRAPGPPGALWRAARDTIAAVEAEGLLRPRDALTCQQILALAAAVDRGLTWGDRVSIATVTLSRQLQDLAAALPTGEADESEAFARLVEYLENLVDDDAGTHLHLVP